MAHLLQARGGALLLPSQPLTCRRSHSTSCAAAASPWPAAGPCSTCCRHASGAAASTSSGSVSSGGHLLRTQQQQRRRRVVARITGKREEYVKGGITDPEDVWGEEAEPEFVEVDTVPIWSPERGRVGERIFNDPDDERATKTISIEDTAYWFAENNAGELPRTHTFPAMPEVEPFVADEDLRCEEVEGCPPRLKLSDLQEGDELAGVITDNWLWHGAFVDVLAEVKGLVPIRQREWQHVQGDLWPGTEVVVRVHKINEFPKYRFPLELELLTPEAVVPHIMSPADYKVPANVGWLYEQGLNIREVTTALGREYEDQVANLEPDMPARASALQFEFGHDAPDADRYRSDWLTQVIEESPGLAELLQDAAVDTSALGTGLLGNAQQQ